MITATVRRCCSILGPLIVGSASAKAAELAGVVWVGRVEIELAGNAGVVTAVPSVWVAERPHIALQANRICVIQNH
jgi:hypothetical protein